MTASSINYGRSRNDMNGSSRTRNISLIALRTELLNPRRRLSGILQPSPTTMDDSYSDSVTAEIDEVLAV